MLWLLLVTAVDPLELAVGAAASAAAALTARAPRRAALLRRLRSGHVGDHVAWLLVGTALLGALTLPGVLGG
ncbi:hypothetical protein [Streptomyces sp. NBC_00582]|uniref:hypothetical protein n=1 Tax=Streptomyces sp. NBC_00582 TaxID=2975783 RepID=UPI002E80F110|nr:hypothetical protein [Streptomyces sp. NBC_00582]WUB68278.1 hypothetical protein OG852_06555 [Streptomyces sp. NBC_00582]